MKLEEIVLLSTKEPPVVGHVTVNRVFVNRVEVYAEAVVEQGERVVLTATRLNRAPVLTALGAMVEVWGPNVATLHYKGGSMKTGFVHKGKDAEQASFRFDVQLWGAK